LEADLRRPAKKIKLPDNKYPKGEYWDDRVTYFIPEKSNFPAVDLIIRVRKIVIAFQMHVSDHENVVPKLLAAARQAGWNKELVEKIILVYLSPSEETSKTLERKFGMKSPSSVDDWVILHFDFIRNFQSLRDMQWNNTKKK
jgi:hypothetical protein